MTRKPFTILGCDPGEVTSAYSVLRVLPGVKGDANQPPKFKSLEIGFISPKDTVRNLTDAPRVEQREGVPTVVSGLEQAVAKFSAKLDSIMQRHEPERLVCERFMARRIHTKATETVGIMNGILTYKALTERKMTVRLVPASEWKLAIKSVIDLEEFYADMAHFGIPPHFIDATSMPIYDACQKSGHPFAAKSLRRIIKAIAEQSNAA